MVESRYYLFSLWTADRHPHDAGADDSAVQPRLNALVDPVVPSDTVPNGHPHLSQSPRLYLSLNWQRTLHTKKTPIRVLLYVFMSVT